LISPDLHEKQATRLAILLTLIAGSAILSFAIGLFGPLYFPAWGVATEAELLEEDVELNPAFEELVETGSQLHKRSLVEQSTKTDIQLSPDAVYESQKQLSRKLQGMQGSFAASSKNGTPDLQSMKDVLHYLTKENVWSGLVVSVLSGDEKAFVQIRNNLLSVHQLNEEQRLMKRSAPQDIPTDHFATVSPLK
jgi:hypothetical protein